jgi:Cdc6-like AAA superfamily ATPase
MDLKEAYRSLDPARPLEPDSTFYVARPGNPVSSIITELRLTDMPRRYLLTGHRGAGKTTELHRIAHELSDEYEIETISAEGDLVSVIRRIEQANPGRTLYLIDGVDKFDFHESDLSLNQFGYLIDALHQQQISAICTIPLAFALSGAFGSILQTIDQLCFLPSINIRAQNGESIPQTGGGVEKSLSDERIYSATPL